MGTSRTRCLLGFASAVLGAAVLAIGEVGAAEISLHVDINDLKSKEIEAKYTTGAGTKEIGWVTDARPMPSKDKQRAAVRGSLSTWMAQFAIGSVAAACVGTCELDL